MHLPTFRGVIDRRLLVNYRIDPSVASSVIPHPFRPKTHAGFAIGGICLIRLRELRPRGIPAALGASSENAAHRFAVEWDDGDAKREGVYIDRRDTGSRLNALVGGRMFPGVHHHARFEVKEGSGHYKVMIDSGSQGSRTYVEAESTDSWPPTSAFAGLDEASTFFQSGSLGYSPGARGGFDGLELVTESWGMTACNALNVSSSYFDDSRRFPAGTIELDHILLMRDIHHRWHARERIEGVSRSSR